MTRRRTMTFYIVTLCAVTLLLIGLANCVRPGPITAAVATSNAYAATATYGAEVWHTQQTEMAKETK